MKSWNTRNLAGGQHTYGHLIYEDRKEVQPVTRVINQEQADIMNRVGQKGYERFVEVGNYKAGDETERFDSIGSLIDAAKEQADPDYKFVIWIKHKG